MKQDGYLIIDCHNHFFPPQIFARVVQGFGEAAVPGFAGTVEDFLSFMKRDGVRRAITLNFLPTTQMKDQALRNLPPDLPDYARAEQEINATFVARIKRNNEWACDIGQEHPEIIPFISVDPLIMSAEEMREEIRDRVNNHGAGGLKLNPGQCRYFAHDRRLWPAYETAQELDLPVMAQSYISKGPTQFSEPKFYGDVLAAFPKLRLVLTHSGLPFWEQVRVLGKKYPQVCFDTSMVLDPAQEGMLTDAEFLSLFREIGMQRIVYGSSFPWHERAPVLERIRSMALTGAEKRQLLGENAVRIFKLSL